MERRDPKNRKRSEQGGKCPVCGEDLPEAGAVLDRLNAMDRYTDANTRVICPACDAIVV
jgi:C4-type Zn-finger protein